MGASASVSPSISPSVSPSASPSLSLSVSPSASPSKSPSVSPSASPSKSPSVSPSASPSPSPSEAAYAGISSSTTAPLRGTRTIKWTGLNQTGDTGAKINCVMYPYKTVHVTGTFDGATVTIRGSNMIDDPTWVTLNDNGGSALTFTSAAVKTIRENTYWISPILTGGGAATDLEVYLLMWTER